MGRSQYTGLPRAPHLIGLPAASMQNGGWKPVAVECIYLSSSEIYAPLYPCEVEIIVISPGGRGFLSGGGGGGCAYKRRRVLPNEKLILTIDPGTTATNFYDTRGSISIDGVTVTGGQNGSSSQAAGDPFGGIGGVATGGQINNNGGQGGRWSGGGERGGSAASLTGPGLMASTASTGPYSGGGGSAGGGPSSGGGGQNYGGGGGGGGEGGGQGGAHLCILRFIPV
ncbi:hypothetical protein [Azospirillum cavernae]|uniref:hypothetical protein n=1 Tax=Azospirillum cavernae TaxID=2320860 RepID=UPI0013140A0E|nr:hypothetical protein [Azospirillum cavernae]